MNWIKKTLRIGEKIKRLINKHRPTKEEMEKSDWTSTIINHINSNVKVVSISSCHWANGEYIDLELVSKKCKENKL